MIFVLLHLLASIAAASALFPILSYFAFTAHICNMGRTPTRLPWATRIPIVWC